MARFLEKNYDTILVVDPTITTKANLLGYFTEIDDMPAIALRPKDIINLGRDDYSTLMHEARHVRYDFMRKQGKESIFHTELFDVNRKNAFQIPGEKLKHYQDYMTLEELPLHANDLQREIYWFSRSSGVEKKEYLKLLKLDMQKLKELTMRTKSWVTKFSTSLEGPEWNKVLQAGIDDYDLYFTMEIDNVKFRTKFVKPETLKKMLKIDEERLASVGKKLLEERMLKLNSFLSEMELNVLEMEKSMQKFSTKKMTEEEFIKDIGKKYSKIKKQVSLESSLE